MSRSPATVRPRAAFTLLELVVTLSVIAILATMTMMSLSRSGEIRGVDSGIGMIRDMARAARAQAILAGQPARLIINYDETDPDRFLRYLGIVVREVVNRDDDEDGVPEAVVAWQAVDRGAYLPQGVYFIPQPTAPVVFAENWPEKKRRSKYKITNTGNDDAARMNLQYPLATVADAGNPEDPAWIVYQFSPNGSVGSMVDGLPPSSNLVVVGRAESDGPMIRFPDAQAVRAVLFKLSGATLPVEELDRL